MGRDKTKQPKLKKADELPSVETAVRLYLPNDLLKRPDADLSDLTDCNRCEAARWSEDEPDVLVLDFDGPPSDEEQTAIRRRLVTADAADEARLYDLIAARAATTTLFERLWLDTELAKYGETTSQ